MVNPAIRHLLLDILGQHCPYVLSVILHALAQTNCFKCLALSSLYIDSKRREIYRRSCMPTCLHLHSSMHAHTVVFTCMYSMRVVILNPLKSHVCLAWSSAPIINGHQVCTYTPTGLNVRQHKSCP